MKEIYMLSFVVLMLSVSCQKDQTPNVEISSADIAAIDNMEKSYNSALQYNDSIFHCMDFDPLCENEYLEYCDNMFHQYADEYENNHNNYSHECYGDNDHEGYMSHNNHGNGMMGNNNQGQCCDSKDQMDSLLEYHEDYH